MSNPFSGLSGGFPPGPRTPEPTASFAIICDDAQPPSPPRPRLRLKRRAVPHLSAPTQNFLASVAAADVPIPSIEVPEHDHSSDILHHHQQQQNHQHQTLFPIDNVDRNFLNVQGRAFSPPKTPAPDSAPLATSQSRYPNWSMDSVFSSSVESSPDRECGSSSRPSTARSTQTSSSSLFSRFSQLSDDDNCISPDEETSIKSKFSFGAHSNQLRRNSVSAGTYTRTADDGNGDNTPSNQSRHARKVSWTKAMSSHLWATYILYLQDPKVTPFRVGRSCVPPHGVLLRVAREAKRSWKGAKAMAKVSANNTDAACMRVSLPAQAPVVAASTTDRVGAQSDETSNKSGSSTPTADSASSGTFMEWPFTNAATRAHLRELCRLKAATPGGGARGLQYMSRSPTPFTQTATTRHRNLRFTQGPSTFSTFGTQDMALSLSLSTSETMQPQGPLAQLTRSGADVSHNSTTTGSALSPDNTNSLSAVSASGEHASAYGTQGLLDTTAPFADADEPSFAERRRLGSPFTARSYGPSSSSSLASVLGLSTSNSRQPHTVGPRRSLQSPVRLSRSGTQKMRRTKHLSQDLRRRPGLASDFFTDPSPIPSFSFPGMCEGKMNAESSSSNTTHNDELFMPRAEALPPLTLTSSSSAPQLMAATASSEAMLDDFMLNHQTSVPTMRSLDGFNSGPIKSGLLDSVLPPRLGSPFSSLPGNSTSFSFPNRFSQPADFDMASLGRPFATVQRTAQPKAVLARTNLASRLAYIDQRLRELNNRNESSRRRSDSPV